MTSSVRSASPRVLWHDPRDSPNVGRGRVPAEEKSMRLGLTMARTCPDGGALTGEALVTGARLVERAGFDSLWCFDAIGRGFILPDPLIAVSVAAAATERLTVGTCILQVPLRRPVELAHRILTASLVCGDRLLLGVGAGSTRADFDAVGVDFDARMREFGDA